MQRIPEIAEVDVSDPDDLIDEGGFRRKFQGLGGVVGADGAGVVW